VQSDQRQPPAELPTWRGAFPGCPPSQVLERIKRARVAQQEAEAELAALIDHAVGLGIGWPEIADQLGVTRQAARQHYQRRHRKDANRRDRAT
jgi:predicted transcriptional regulator